jgi:uncharacterized RDD family membrane protein YckC
MNIVPAGLGKRSGAAIIDILIAAIVWFGLLAYAIQPIFNVAYHTYDIQEEYQAIQVESKLYTLDEDYGTVSVLGEDEYATGTFAYYTVYKFARNEVGDTTTNSVPWYNTTILKIGTDDSLFVYAQTAGIDDPSIIGVRAPIEGSDSMTSEQLSSAIAAQDEDLADFYYTIYAAAVTDLNAQDDYLALANQLAYFFKWELAIATAIVLLIFYFAIPMILKDGRTLGKQIFGLSLVNKLGYKVTKLQISIRFLAFALFEIVGSVFTMMGTILISYTIMIFGKKNMSVHDFAASTRVIDGKRSVWFKNATEAAAYQAEIDKNSSKASYSSLIVDAVPETKTPQVEQIATPDANVVDEEKKPE